MADADEMPERCSLEHRFFSNVSGIRFRRSPVDGVPTLAMALGDRQASIPLRSLWRELEIADDSADGRMLGWIGEALDFVSDLQPGDRLPPEVRTGQASWTPSARHIALTTTKLRLRLAARLCPAPWAQQPGDADSLLCLSGGTELPDAVAAVAATAAGELDLPDAAALLALVEEFGGELAYIEALRERLLLRVDRMVGRTVQLSQKARGSADSSDTVTQVRRLGQMAFKQIRSRFSDVAAQTVDLPVRGEIEARRDFIRTNRDWLYRSQRAWDPLLQAWEQVASPTDEALPGLLNRTYQFLAPRFMPSNEWQVQRHARGTREVRTRMTW